MVRSNFRQNSFLSDSRVIVVDPSRTNRSILSGLIEDLKPEYFVLTKSTAEARLAMESRVEPFDLILLSIINPPMSGFHFLQVIRGGGLQGVPRQSRVILISQPPNRTMIDLAGKLDADGLLALPMSPASVEKCLLTALGREREIKSAQAYLEIHLPKPVRKKPKEDDPNPNAKIVWLKREKQKAELMRSLEETLAQIEEEKKVEAQAIENVRTFWLKDLHAGMILAENINGEEDELLLATGTPLNDPLIEKIKKFSEIGLCRSFLKAGTAPNS